MLYVIWVCDMGMLYGYALIGRYGMDMLYGYVVQVFV